MPRTTSEFAFRLDASSGVPVYRQIIDQVNESSRLATIGGTLATFLAATAAFAALQDSLSRIWNLPTRPDSGIIEIGRAHV